MLVEPRRERNHARQGVAENRRDDLAGPIAERGGQTAHRGQRTITTLPNRSNRQRIRYFLRHRHCLAQLEVATLNAIAIGRSGVGAIDTESSITALLQQMQQRPGDAATASRFASAVYASLRRLAGDRLRSEPDTISSATDLVHEFWMQLDITALRADSREHFFRTASTVMRHLLVDRARARLSQKRGAGAESVSLRWADAQVDRRFDDVRLLDLDVALERLHHDHPRPAEMVVLRCFGGMELGEIGEVLGISLATVKRDWTFANAWLANAMRES